MGQVGQVGQVGKKIMSKGSGVAGVVLFSLVVALVSAVRATETQPRVVKITAERFTFTPSEVTVAPGTEIEFQLTSEDTAHGFRILGQSVELSIPKRGRGEATVRFTPPGEGTLHVRVFPDVRRRPQLHARDHQGRRATRRAMKADLARQQFCW